ncbi:unnamed protein product [Fusarium graminearum]|uniref:Chromosome 4, complete genome n=1 Tax=Gibberella zeae (strain ATCC MYA-4620 / CBS 123657 / FGSC 9075 / NRRL 31084 / PH-1) TaxID=229533 RepID=A0A098DTI7_GIBZE|nr:unnamed protein product [Fusarium graminearum]
MRKVICVCNFGGNNIILATKTEVDPVTMGMVHTGQPMKGILLIGKDSITYSAHNISLLLQSQE